MAAVSSGPRLAIARLNMRSLFAAAYILAISSAALAQTITIQIDGLSKITLSPRDCDSTHTVNWTMTATGQLCSAAKFWITRTNCGNDAAGDDIVLTPSPSQTDRSGQFTTPPLRNFPAFVQTDGGFACGAAVNQTHLVCGAVRVPSTFQCGSSDNFVTASSPGTIDYRGIPPAAPTITDLSPQDSALTVHVSTTSDVVTVHVQIRVAGSGNFNEVASFSTSVNNSVKIGNLQNGVAYEVQAIGEDAAGNQSDPSNIAQATPVASEGFFEEYRRLGGKETGGCGGALPGVISVPLAFGGYRLLRRKRSCRRDS